MLTAAQSVICPEDTACILYTSGSTALPKGVPLHHWAMIDNAWSIGERQHLTPDDRLWLGVALFWSYGCVNALFALMTHGGTIVLQHHFEPGEALRLIERERCTVFYGTAAMSRPAAGASRAARAGPLHCGREPRLAHRSRCNWSSTSARKKSAMFMV